MTRFLEIQAELAHSPRRWLITVEGGQAILRQGERVVCGFPTAKQPRETRWTLAGIALRGA